MKPEELSEA